MSKRVICVIDRKGTIIRINRAAEKVLHVKSSELEGQPFTSLFRPQSKASPLPDDIFREPSSMLRNPMGVWTFRFSEFTSFACELYPSKHVDYHLLIGKQVAETPPLAPESLPAPTNASSSFSVPEELTHIVEDMAEAVVRLDHQLNYTYLNKKALELLGKPKEELIGQNIWQPFPEWVNTSFYYACIQAFNEKKTIQHEEYLPVLDKWFSSRLIPGKTGLTIFFQETTWHKATEAALAKSDKLYRSIFESHPDALFVTDRHGTIQKINDIAASKFKTPSGKLMGNSILTYLSADSRSKMSAVIPQVLKGKTMQLEGWVEKVDNSFLATISLIPIRLEGSLTGFYITFRDITQKFQQEQALALLNALSMGLSAAPNLTEGMDTVLRKLCQFTGYLYGEWWMPIFGHNLIKLTSHWLGDASLLPFYEASKNQSFEPDKDLPPALKERKVVVSNAVNQEAGFRRKVLAAEHGLNSYLLIPILYRNTYLGTIGLFAKEPVRLTAIHQDQLQNILNKLGGEIERRHSSEELEKFFTLSPDLLCIVGFDGFFKKTNPAFLQTFGYTSEEMLSFHLLDLVHPKDYANFDQTLAEAYEGRPVRNIESRFRCKDGSYRWIAVTEEAVAEENLLYVVGRDVTEQKKQVAEISRIKAATESTSDAIGIVQGLEQFIYTNKAFEKLLGLNKESINHRGGIISLFSAPEKAQELHYILHQKGRWEGDVYILDHEGNSREFNLRCNAILNEQGVFKYFVTIFTDVSEKRKVQAEIYRLNKAVEESSNEVYIVDDEKYNFTYANKRALENSGYSLGELKQLTPTALNPDLNVERAEQFLQPLRRGETKSLLLHTRQQRKDGSWYPAEAHLSLFSYENTSSLMVQLIDITERKRTEESLRIINERYRLAAKASNDAIWDWDLTTNRVFWGDGFYTLFGHRFTENSDAASWENNIHPQDAKQAIEKIFDILHSGKNQWVSEYRFKCADGSFRYVRDRAYVIYDTSGKAIRLTGAITDISEQKKNEEFLLSFNAELEEQVIKKTAKLQASLKKIKKEMAARATVELNLQQSLVEKEVLLKEIHHRVKNNMAIVSGLLTLQARHAKQQEVKLLFKDSQRRIKSMALIHELLYQNENLSRINFRNYIQELVDGISSSFQQRETYIKIEIDAEPGIELDIVQAVPCGLILNELITNSFKYAFVGKENGRIKIIFRKREESFLLEVSDNGQGLPVGFETAYPKTLGMQLVSNLVKQIGGQLQISSQQGASFKIIFN